jgi:hypothetical protein
VGVGGFEPPTSALSGRRSNQLSYTPRFEDNLFSESVHSLKTGEEGTTKMHPITPDGVTRKNARGFDLKLSSSRPDVLLERR